MPSSDGTGWQSVRYHLPTLAVVGLGIAASIVAWHLMAGAEKRAVAGDFAARANNHALVLQSGIDQYLRNVYALRALFESSSRPITRREFEVFGSSLLQGQPAILNVAWIPRVARDQRAAHELAAARDGIADYRIMAIGPDGSLVVAPEKDEYFPKFYSTEPRSSPVYGLDLDDGGRRLETVLRARDDDVLASSPPLELRIGAGDRRGFWVGLPVYASGLPHDTVEERRRNFLGLVQGVFQIGVLVETVLADIVAPVRLYLFAPGAGAGDRSIYQRSRLGPGTIAARSQAALAGDLHHSYQLAIGDARWTLVVTREWAGPAALAYDRSLIVLLGGLLISALLAAYVWAARRNAGKLRSASRRFEVQNLRFEAALENMLQGLLMFDGSGRLVVFNRRFVQIFGVPWDDWTGEAPGRTVPQVMKLVRRLTGITEKEPARIRAELQRILSRGEPGTIVFERTDGRALSASTAPMSDGGFVVTFEDVTERLRAEAHISHLAHHDVLTGLPNRFAFQERMRERLRGLRRDGILAVLSMDLDRFKSVNDTLGHPVGDKLLQAAAERMRGCVRDGDIVARLGGDEFAVVPVAAELPEDMAALATRLIAAISAPYDLDGHRISIGASIGIAVAPGDGTDADQLMKHADRALYRSKAGGCNTFRFFDPRADGATEEGRSLDLDARAAAVGW